MPPQKEPQTIHGQSFSSMMMLESMAFQLSRRRCEDTTAPQSSQCVSAHKVSAHITPMADVFLANEEHE